jgi:MFS transporter, Spinster family, sphingosine-1-phosphate transporter
LNPPRRAAFWAVALLTLANLLNYLDRFIVPALVESLKRSEMKPNDAQLGLLATAFLIVYMLASPVFGRLGDRGNRPRLLAAGVALWSLATAAGAFAGSYAALFAARAAVGVGEAAYATIAPAMLADLYPREKRGRAFAVFFLATPVGSALGYILGGLIDQRYGWRAAFLVAGAPGLLLALAFLALRDPPRGGAEPEESDDLRSPGPQEAPVAGFFGPWRRLLRNGLYVRTVAGYAAYTFALGALAFWTPAFLERVRGVPRAEATVVFGAIAVATGIVGTLAGGWLTDKLKPEGRRPELWLSGWATLAAAPFAAAAFFLPERSAYLTAIVVAELLLFCSTGPINAVIVGVVSPAERATASALAIFAIHAFGDVPSPPLVGLVSDSRGLQTAFLVLLPPALLVGGWIWLAASRRRSAG